MSKLKAEGKPQLAGPLGGIDLLDSQYDAVRDRLEALLHEDTKPSWLKLVVELSNQAKHCRVCLPLAGNLPTQSEARHLVHIGFQKNATDPITWKSAVPALQEAADGVLEILLLLAVPEDP